MGRDLFAALLDARGVLRVSVLAVGASIAFAGNALAATPVVVTSDQAAAVGQQADPAAFAPSKSATIGRHTVQPGWRVASQGWFVSQGALVDSSVGSDPSSGFVLGNSQFGDLAFRPTETSPAATATSSAGAATVVAANTAVATDTITRPLPLGIETLEQLRNAAAPTQFSWQVSIGPFQRLRLLPDGSVAVIELNLGTTTSRTLGQSAGLADIPSNPVTSQRLANGGPTLADLQALAAIDRQVAGNPLGAPAGNGAAQPTTTGASPPALDDTQALYDQEMAAANAATQKTSDQVVAVMLPPTATDASGGRVATGLAIHGDVITLTVQPTPSTSYPVEVDPTTIQPPPSGTHWATLGLSTQQDEAFQNPDSRDYKTVQSPYAGVNSISGLEPYYDYLIGVGNGNWSAAHIVRINMPYNLTSTSCAATDDPGTGKSNASGSTWCQGLNWWLYKGLEDAIYRGVAFYPLLSIASGADSSIPSPSAYATAVSSLMSYYDPPGQTPLIQLFESWNEPDGGSAEAVSASTAASYWIQAEQDLANNGCMYASSNPCARVIGGDFAYLHDQGSPSYEPYVSSYISAITQTSSGGASLLGYPAVWSYHAYPEITNGTPNSTTDFVNQLGGTQFKGNQVWMSEGGVLLRDPDQIFSTDGNTSQAMDAAYNDITTFDTHIRENPNIAAVLYYAMDEGDNLFDSQLFESEREARHAGHTNSSTGQAAPLPRPAYCGLVYWAESSCTGNNLDSESFAAANPN